MPTTTTVFVDPTTHVKGWGYTKEQEENGFKQLRRIAKSYPMPGYLGGIKKGSLLVLDDQATKNSLHKIISQFYLSVPASHKYSFPENIIEKMGDIPLREIYDPQLKNLVRKIWTFDISYNPALSIKDVMARQMIKDALNDKKIYPGITKIVEATSGNTGAGLALVAAFYGFSTILIVPSKVSAEKIERLRSFGAHVIVAPSNVSPSDYRSYYSIRDFLGKLKASWVPQQYNNPSNTKGHELVTGPKIWEQTEGRVTTVIAPTGTGGTASGIGRFLKKKNSSIKLIGVDTIGSILYLLKKGHKLSQVQKYSHSYDIQGFGEDIYPKNLDLSVIDEYVRVSDASGLLMTQVLPALGFFQGQSSGASYAALLEVVEKGIITQEDSVVVLFPDTAIPYRNDVFNDEWMKSKNFYQNY